MFHTPAATPRPTLSWETAADSIQKCINYTVAGDTIIVANGTYHESLVVNKYLSLIGSSMDSTIIDGTGLANNTVDFLSNCNINNFIIIGKGEGISNTTAVNIVLTNVAMQNCRISNALVGIGLVMSSSSVNQCILSNVTEGYDSYCDLDTCNPFIENSIILLPNNAWSGILINSGDNIAKNNIILSGFNSQVGIQSHLFGTASFKSD